MWPSRNRCATVVRHDLESVLLHKDTKHLGFFFLESYRSFIEFKKFSKCFTIWEALLPIRYLAKGAPFSDLAA